MADMIWTDTDLLEELNDKLSVCASKGEEAWNFLRMAANEMIDDLDFMALPQAELLYSQLTSAIQSCEIMKEMLSRLKNILASLPEGYKTLETVHENRICQITEVTAALTANLRVVFQERGSAAEWIGMTEELGKTRELEQLVQGMEEKLPEESLAAVTEILKETFRYDEVVHEADS